MESAHISLAKRSQLFYRKFGEKKISPSTIWRIYFMHIIRFKNIKREARERSILPNRITANSSIICIHSCSRYVNQTHSWCTSMKLCTPSGVSERKDKRKIETEIVSTILIWELPSLALWGVSSNIIIQIFKQWRTGARSAARWRGVPSSLSSWRSTSIPKQR